MTFEPPSGPPSAPPSGPPPSWPPPPSGPPPWPPAGSAAPPGGEPSAPRPKRGIPTGLAVAAAAVVGALVVLAALVLLGDDGDDTVAAPTTSQAPPATTLPSPPSPPPSAPSPSSPLSPPPTQAPARPPAPPVTPVACPADVPAEICAAADFVQVETGRPYRQFPAVELLDQATFQARVAELQAEEDQSEVEAAERTMVALGLLEPDVDLVQIMQQLLSATALGLYVPEDDTLLVRSSGFTPLTRAVVVHELTHALDDQWYGLDRLDDEGLADEEAFGLLAVTEGHARVIENRYRQQMTPQEQGEAVREEFRIAMSSGIDLLSVPPVLLEQLVAPYVLGEQLVDAILDRGGVQALEEAFNRPPTSAEQVLHPEKFFSGEAPVAVPEPPADGEVVEADVAGELGLVYLLGDESAGRGWGGDRYVTWQEGTSACVRLDVVMDTPSDLERLRADLEEWEGRGDRRQVDEVDVAGTSGLRVLSCAG